MMKKSIFLGRLVRVVSVLFLSASLMESAEKENSPNIILLMADDLGWGDVGYNGNAVIKTPHLDKMAKEGVRFDRFYSAAPVCSPTRGSCYTGRHPFRYGITYAMSGKLEAKEIVITTLLKKAGYTTGHFGKWHMGALTPNKGDQNRWGGFEKDPAKYYCAPWDRDVDVCFVTESKVPTWDPMKTPRGGKGERKGLTAEKFGNDYFVGEGEIATENLEGDDSRVMMDRAIPFIQNAVKEGKSFFSVIWFHAPHKPVVAGPEYRALYQDRSLEEQHYFGCITALDEQVGRLREELEKLKVSENTMIWFCSDNGPTSNNSKGRSAGGLSGHKTQLKEGGVRVPGLLVWPGKIKAPLVIKAPATTSDYFPTILAELEIPLPKDRIYDGVDLWPLIEQKVATRNKPIGMLSQKQEAWIGARFKLYSKNGKAFQLYDLTKDRAEKKDVSDQYPEVKTRMLAELGAWKKRVLEDQAQIEDPSQIP